MIVYEVLVKRKVSLDQLIEGLQILDVLNVIRLNPESMKPYFVPSQALTAESILNKVDFFNGNHNQKSTFTEALESFDDNSLSRFCIFATGASSIGAAHRLTVKFGDADSIVSSTCTYEVKIPNTLSTDISLLRPALLSVIDDNFEGQFNTM